MKLVELARAIGSDIKVEQRLNSKTGKWDLYSVDFMNLVEFKLHKNNGILSSVYGKGKTKNEAIHNLVAKINNYEIIVTDAYSPNRKEMSFGVITV